MKKPVVMIVALVVLGACVVVIAREARHMPKGAGGGAAMDLPPAYSKVVVGMTPAEVTALVGKPQSKAVNAHFQAEPERYWASVKAKLAAADPQAADPSVAPNIATLKLGALYEHRIKQIWHYQPNGHVYEQVAFGGNGRVCDVATGYVMQSSGKP